MWGETMGQLSSMTWEVEGEGTPNHTALPPSITSHTALSPWVDCWVDCVCHLGKHLTGAPHQSQVGIDTELYVLLGSLVQV